MTEQQEIEKVRDQIITEFSKTVEMFDLNPAEARLFVTLYIKGEPMTLDDMSEALGKSKTSMSTAVRSLLDINLVERVWKKGVRKDLYKADENLYRKFMISYTKKWIDITHRQKTALTNYQDTVIKPRTQNQDLQNANKEKLMKLADRLSEIIEFHQMIEQAFLDISTYDN